MRGLSLLGASVLAVAAKQHVHVGDYGGLHATPSTLSDDQSVVIHIPDVVKPGNDDTVFASCDRATIPQRVPNRDVVTMAPCDGRAAQKWRVDEESGRFLSLQDDAGRRCLDASCFETPSQSIYAQEATLCQSQRRDLHGVDWCTTGIEKAGFSWDSNEAVAQTWAFTEHDQLATSYDGTCLESKSVTYGLGEEGAELVVLRQCNKKTDAQKFELRRRSHEIVQPSTGYCLTVDETGVVAPPDGYAAAVRFGNLPGLRCDWKFTYVSHANGEIARLTVPAKVPAAAPRHVRLSWGDDPGDMWVSWTSDSSSKPTVQYIVGNDNVRLTATGTSNTYTAADMCSAPANESNPYSFKDPGYQHHVLLQGLPEGAAVEYSVGNDSDQGWSKYRSIKVPLREGTDETVTFLGYGDMGVSADMAGHATALLSLRDVIENDASFVLHFGDLSYACGMAFMWDVWHSMIEPLSSRVPYLVSMGNHEFEWSGSYWGGDSSHGECGVPVINRFKSPSNGNGILWYSMGSGPVHIVTLSTEHDVAPGSDQYKWLEADLAGVDRTKTPWVVVTAHRMLYSTQMCEDGDKDRSEQYSQWLDGLLAKYKVNLVLVGHQHSYERTCPIINGTCAEPGQGGTTHVVVGSAGADLEQCGFSQLVGPWDVVHSNMYGFSRMTAARDSFRLQMVSNIDGSLFDEVELQQWPDDEA